MLEASLREEIGRHQAEMVALRRELHRWPELSFQEEKTAGVVYERLKALELDEVRAGVGGYGVVATIKGGQPGKTVMVRADMDGLPIQEQNEVEYRSENPAAMHACGHDGHITIALTLAKILAAKRDELPGTVKFAFQPAEERGGGASAMIKDGALSGPEVDAVVGLHLWNNLPVGQLGITDGPIFANADGFEITVHGKGGHGALPHQTVDALLVASEIVVALQTLVSRESTPMLPAVVTVGSFHSGSAFNVINEEATIAGTFRTVTPEARQYLTRRIREMAEGIAGAMRASIEIDFKIGVPAVVNDPTVTAAVREAGKSVLGAENVVTVSPVTIGDDMSEFLLAKPGCYFLMGSANSARGLDWPHHHPRFDFDESCMAPAVEILGRSVLELGSGR
jgi:amidohydrolase